MLETGRRKFLDPDEAKALSRRFNNVYTRARSLNWDSMLRQFIGDWPTVIARAEEAMAIAAAHGFALVQAGGEIMLGWARVHMGQVAEGVRQIQQGVDAYRATGADVRP